MNAATILAVFGPPCLLLLAVSAGNRRASAKRIKVLEEALARIERLSARGDPCQAIARRALADVSTGP